MLDKYLQFIESQIFWSVVLLALFMLASYLFVVPSISNAIRNREDIVNTYLRNAEELLLQAKSLDQESKKIMQMTRDDVHAIITRTEGENAKLLEVHTEAHRAMLKRKKTQMHENFTKLLEDSRGQLLRIAHDITEYGLHVILASKIANFRS